MGGRPHGSFDHTLRGLTFTYSPAVIGALIGAAIGTGFRRGHSKLPGANALIRSVASSRERYMGAALPAGPADLVPSAGPEGSGDEPTPSG